MSDTADVLVELGVEELPAGSVLPMADFLGTELQKSLTDAGLSPADLQVFATPRRIAALLTQVAGRQAERVIQKRGPAVSAAFDDVGEPSRALQGFARSCGVNIDQLNRLKTEKGEWMVFDSHQAGQTVGDIIAESLPGILKQMPMPKRMRWAGGEEEFLRPVEWLLVLHGYAVLSVQALGLTANRLTRGHRFHAPGEVSISEPSQYEATLYDNHVIASFDERRTLIRNQVRTEASGAGAVLELNEDLLDEVTALVEWPVALTGAFEEEFLEVPKEALIQTMEENQRYFALFDKDSSLLPRFVTVSNIDSNNPDSVREGNERVIRPRFKDTMFFWKNDIARDLLSYRDGLKTVLFQQKLGSIYEKSERLVSLVGYIAPRAGAELTECSTAAKLCKCDLLTDIVVELPKMQGIAGRYYAEREGYPATISKALEEQYWPKRAGGELPLSTTGLVLGIADRADTLTGIYGIGLKPTGAKDPFGLRRASLGLLRALVERGVNIDLLELFETSADTYLDKLDQTFNIRELVTYVLDRLGAYYREQGESGDVVEAVLATGITNPLDIDQRIKAVSLFYQTDAASSLAAANKRIRNLLKKVEVILPDCINESLLTEPAEKVLADTLANIQTEIEPYYRVRNYQQAMSTTSRLKEPVDIFFDEVMVMVDNEQIRNNRLALLKQVGELCSQTADISKLQIEVIT